MGHRRICCFGGMDWFFYRNPRRPPTSAASAARAVRRSHAVLETFRYDEARDRREYAAVCREAMRALAKAVFPDAVVQKYTETVYHVRTKDGAFEFKWADSGLKRFWNVYIYVDGEDRWRACAIDAAQENAGRVRFEICYDRDFVRTEDIEKSVRRRKEGKDVRLFTAGEDVGQQSGLTLEMLHDVLKAAVERRYSIGVRTSRNTDHGTYWWRAFWPW